MARSGRREGRETRFLCLAHDDHSPSARWNPEKAVWHCDACGAEGGALDLAERLGIELPAVRAQGFCETVYRVCDAAGRVVAEHVRRDLANGKKRMSWRRDGQPGLGGLRTTDLPLYGAEHVRGFDASRPVFVVEGEKAAERLIAIGAQAVGTVTGATGTPSAGSLAALRGREAVLWPDADSVGASHMKRIASTLAGIAATVRTFSPPGIPDHGDAVDWIERRQTDGESPAQVLLELERAALLEQAAQGSPEASRSAAHRSVFRSLAEILADPAALDPPQPVVPRIAWRGRVSLLAGREKEGKSTLASAAAAAVTRGAAFLEGPALQGDVLYLALEEHESDVATRLSRFGADPARIFVAVQLERPSEDLEKAAAEHRPVLIVVDTLAAFVGGDIEDPGNSSAWTPLMARLVRIARDHDSAVLLLHHARKSDGTYRDSTAIGAAVDVLLEIRLDQQDPNARHLKARGRFEVPDTSVCLTSNGFSLASGGASLEDRALAFVQSNPGCSLRQVVNGVAGRDSDISDTVHALLDRGGLVNTGSSRALALRVADTLPGTPPGNTQGNAASPDPLPE